MEPGEDGSSRALLLAALPVLRGALLADATGSILEVDRSPEAVAFASAERDAPRSARSGAPCPDHLINTKHRPLVVDYDPGNDDDDALGRGDRSRCRRVLHVVPGPATRANVDDESRPVPDGPALARVLSCSPVSASSPRTGADARRARIARDLTSHRAIAREDAADAIGGFQSLSEPEAFAIEYWPLERYKLAQAPPRGELGGRIALITPVVRAGSGRATARVLAERGAHVVVADLNVDRAEGSCRRARRDAWSASRARRRAWTSPVKPPSKTWFTLTSSRYGGLDILVSSAGLATSAPITETTLAEWQSKLRRARARLLPRLRVRRSACSS